MQAATIRMVLFAVVVVMAATLAGGSWFVVVFSGCRAVVQLQHVDAAAVISLDLAGYARFCAHLVR